MSPITDCHAKYFAFELTKRSASDSMQKLASTLVDAQADLNPHQAEAALFAFRSPAVWKEDILYELLLKSGFELTSPITTLALAGKTVYCIAEGELLVCLDRLLTLDVLKAMAEMLPSRVICLDEGFAGADADAVKTNAVQLMKSNWALNYRMV